MTASVEAELQPNAELPIFHAMINGESVCCEADSPNYVPIVENHSHHCQCCMQHLDISNGTSLHDSSVRSDRISSSAFFVTTAGQNTVGFFETRPYPTCFVGVR